MELVTKNKEKIFDKSGEINAWDREDAIVKIAKYLQARDESPFEKEAVSPYYTESEQDYILKNFDSRQIRKALGQTMVSPLKTFLEYKGVMRRAFTIDKIATGAFVVYNRDTENITSDVIASQSAVSQVRISSEKIMIPLLEIAARPLVKLRDVKITRFNIIDRIQVRTRQFMQEQEDALLINLLDSASTVVNQLVKASVTSNEPYSGRGLGYIRRQDLISLMAQVAQHDLFARNIFMSIYRYYDLLKWGRDEVDILTQRQLIDTGLIAQLAGVNIYVTKKIPRDVVYCTTDKEYLGVMAISQDIDVIPADEPAQTTFGWVFTELIGAAVFNPKGVAKLQVIYE